MKEDKRVIKNSLIFDKEKLILLIKNIQNIFDLMTFLVNQELVFLYLNLILAKARCLAPR